MLKGSRENLRENQHQKSIQKLDQKYRQNPPHKNLAGSNFYK
jgi:hypothetical protein